MIIFTILFFAIDKMADIVFNVLFGNMDAVYTILSILIFVSLALLLIESSLRWVLVVFCLAVILYAGFGLLAPYQDIICKVLAIVLSIVGMVLVKRPLLQYVRNDEEQEEPRIPTWVRWVLRLI